MYTCIITKYFIYSLISLAKIDKHQQPRSNDSTDIDTGNKRILLLLLTF